MFFLFCKWLCFAGFRSGAINQKAHIGGVSGYPPMWVLGPPGVNTRGARSSFSCPTGPMGPMGPIGPMGPMGPHMPHGPHWKIVRG